MYWTASIVAVSVVACLLLFAAGKQGTAHLVLHLPEWAVPPARAHACGRVRVHVCMWGSNVAYVVPPPGFHPDVKNVVSIMGLKQWLEKERGLYRSSLKYCDYCTEKFLSHRRNRELRWIRSLALGWC